MQPTLLRACWRRAGLAVQLVNSCPGEEPAGPAKTDKADAQWMARLTEMGLLRP